MNPLGFLGPADQRRAPAGPPGQPQLQLQDALESRLRLWIRGRLHGLPQPSPGGKSRWRLPRPGSSARSENGRTGQLRVEISGSVLTADVPLDGDGRFEALLNCDLPPARRGWRVARQELTYDNATFRACGLLLTPDAKAAQATVVLLPPSVTRGAEGPEWAAGLCRALQRREAAGAGPLYYVGAVAPGADQRPAELAVALTAQGCPPGHLVLEPAGPTGAEAAVCSALDRLRWLFAGILDLTVISLGPSPLPGLEGCETADRARVRRVVVAPEDSVPSSRGPTAPALPRPLLLNRVPRYPVVFCHGMLAQSVLRMKLPENTNYFAALGPFFRERGVRALFPQVEPTGGVAVRAGQLREQVLRWTDGPVNLVAHSMGGLDARYLTTHLGMAGRVRSLTTVSTPHRGSPVADWFCANFRRRIPLLLALEAFGMDVDGIAACRLADCAAFNRVTPDVPGVRYFSYGASVPHARVTPFLRRAWSIIAPKEGDNDGLVSVASARWGEYLGTLAVDHYAQTPGGLFVRPGEDFDSPAFYARLIEDLARRGF